MQFFGVDVETNLLSWNLKTVQQSSSMLKGVNVNEKGKIICVVDMR